MNLCEQYNAIYIYIYIVVISACALLEYSILLLSILTRQGVKCGTGKFPETFWFISLSLPWVFEAWSYKAIQSDLSYTTGFRTIPDNSNDKADITRRSLILPAYLTQIHGPTSRRRPTKISAAASIGGKTAAETCPWVGGAASGPLGENPLYVALQMGLFLQDFHGQNAENDDQPQIP